MFVYISLELSKVVIFEKNFFFLIFYFISQNVVLLIITKFFYIQLFISEVQDIQNKNVLNTLFGKNQIGY